MTRPSLRLVRGGMMSRVEQRPERRASGAAWVLIGAIVYSVALIICGFVLR